MKMIAIEPIKLAALACGRRQKGVLLIVTMILLLIISGVAAFAIKGTSSTEAVANNTRTHTLAMQAAEAALRVVEVDILNKHYATNAATVPAISPAPPAPTYLPPYAMADKIKPAPSSVPGADWASATTWDNKDSIAANMVSLAKLDGLASCPSVLTNETNRAGNFCAVYKRAPECMSQYAPDSSNRIVWVTCRGFGPDVLTFDENAAWTSLPNGAEVFLQSTIRLPFPQTSPL